VNNTLLRVGFNAYLLSSPAVRGWVRYTLNLLAALPAHGVRPVLYSTAPIHPDHLARLPAESYEVRSAPAMRYLTWENIWLPKQLQADGIDVFHCPMNYGMPLLTPCPRVLTLHDAIDIVYYLRRTPLLGRFKLNALRTQFTHWLARIRAEHIITVSEHAKGDIVRQLRVPKRKVTVVYEAADPHFHEAIPPVASNKIRHTHGLTRPYFLYLGGWEGRKNIPFLLRAFAEANCPGVDLVLAGGKSAEREVLTTQAIALGIADRVRFLGFVPEADLPAIYSAAIAFVYPSEYEGFGLQVCEAMAVGCPVLVARATSLPEIAGNGGVSFTLANTGELSQLMHRVATESEFRADLADRASRRSADFSWNQCACETAAIYRELAR
jgi:glycosyltransferase involved in cell wall biosynthesis